MKIPVILITLQQILQRNFIIIIKENHIAIKT